MMHNVKITILIKKQVPLRKSSFSKLILLVFLIVNQIEEIKPIFFSEYIELLEFNVKYIENAGKMIFSLIHNKFHVAFNSSFCSIIYLNDNNSFFYY